MAEEADRGFSILVCKGFLEGQEVRIFKLRQQLISECSVNITTFVVFSTLFGVLTEERLIVKGGCPRGGQSDGQRGLG